MRAVASLPVALLLCFAGCVETGEVLGPAASGDGPSDPELPALAATAVSAGHTHACALYSGQVACWGANQRGQLGVGDVNDRRTPTFVALEVAVRQVTAADRHTCSLDELGRVYCWGLNDRGQLGVGTRVASLLPAPVILPARATAIASSFAHVCALLADASLWCWGQNSEGELGQADPFPPRDDDAERATDKLSPVRVPGTFQSVDTGQGHTCGIRADRSLWCWGRNTRSELGTAAGGQVREPTRVGTDSDWRSVDAGQHHTCALKANGSLWCWGENIDGGFPLGIEANRVEAPSPVGAASTWVALSAHIFHTCARDVAFDLYCWGRNVEGQLGVGDLQLRRSPTRAGGGFAAVSVGSFFTCALRRDGRVVCAGENAAGQLGKGDTDRAAVFEPVELP